MEEVLQQPGALATALAVGAGLLLLVGKQLAGGSGDKKSEAGSKAPSKGKKSGSSSSSSGSSSSSSSTSSSSKSKKSKKKNKKKAEEAAAKKKAAEAEAKAKAEAEAKAKAEAEAQAAAEAKAKAEKAKAAQTNGTATTTSKKKKKKKKGGNNQQNNNNNNNNNKQQDQAAQESEAAAKIAAAAAAAQEAQNDEENAWETVTTKRKKKPMTAPGGQDGVSPEMSGDGTASLSLEIGDFASNIIGPGGSRIGLIQQTSGANVNVDKASKKCTITGTMDQVNKAKDLIIDIIGSQRRCVIDLQAKLALVMGPGGETIKKIQSESGARLDIDKVGSTCTISGKDESVELARSMVESILKNSDSDAIVLGDRDKPAVIGKGGENIRRLQTESGASIDIDSETNVCTITGQPDQVAKASELIRLYIEHRGPPPELVEKLTVSLDNGRLIIGRQGLTIQSLQTSTNTRINVEQSESTGTSDITVSGGRDAVAKCVAAINKLIADNSYFETVQVESRNLIQAIIGAKGVYITKIRDATNARIEIQAGSTEVRITGTKAQVAKAKAMVQKKIDEELGPPPVPSGQTQWSSDLGSATGKIIGAAGSNISRLEKQHGASVIIKKGTMCYVTGKADQVKAVREEIEEVLTRHAEVLEKARKQAEELEKVAAQQNGLSEETHDDVPTDSSYGGWDAPSYEGSWGTDFEASTTAPTPAVNGTAPAAQVPNPTPTATSSSSSNENAWGAPPPTSGW